MIRDDTHRCSLSAEEAVLSVLAASPNYEVRGKKRLQKSAFLCAYCDILIDARFVIRHFGVFSGEVADALDVLTMFGELNTHDEQIGPNGYLRTVYSLPEGPKHDPEPHIASVVDALRPYSTPTLEVASTVAYFTMQGCDESEAIEETKRIKPDLSTTEQFRRTKALLVKLASLRDRGTHGKRSKNS